MKPLSYLLLAISVAVICPTVRAQQQPSTPEYVPTDRDTLDANERDRHGLFKPIAGFQQASFSLNPDSSSLADVCFMLNGERKHIVFPRFRSLADAEDKVEEAYKGVLRSEGIDEVCQMTKGRKLAALGNSSLWG